MTLTSERRTLENTECISVLKIRADPELHCPNFCKKLVVDPAGEWHRSNKFFMHQMVKLGAELDDEGFFVTIDNDKIVDVN